MRFPPLLLARRAWPLAICVSLRSCADTVVEIERRGSPSRPCEEDREGLREAGPVCSASTQSSVANVQHHESRDENTPCITDFCVSARSCADTPSSRSNDDGSSVQDRRGTQIASGQAGRAKRGGGKRTRSVPPLSAACAWARVSAARYIVSVCVGHTVGVTVACCLLTAPRRLLLRRSWHGDLGR